ncbi:hypothetical protein [Duganella dendranthematis]|uniref:hypothetical protein n=1 Tax=Duganella dendranthematis TaxID=2728021 RepID=UPI0018EE6FF7|nr:hypothetical protein [Duganella dendranthematis]
MFIKIMAGIAGLVATIVVAGVSGLSFYLWPTGFYDHELAITPQVIQQLRDLQSEHKFGPNAATFIQAR